MTRASTRALDDVLDFLRILWGVDHALQRASKRMEQAHGVTGPQRLVVRVIGRFPGITSGELARLLELHPSTLTGILHRLEARTLIQRRVDTGDRRRALFALTDKGTSLDAALPHTIEATMTAVLAKVDKRKLAATRSMLMMIREDLRAYHPAKGS
jgi:DNA-binding MarR family transcriptional regulator